MKIKYFGEISFKVWVYKPEKGDDPDIAKFTPIFCTQKKLPSWALKIMNSKTFLDIIGRPIDLKAQSEGKNYIEEIMIGKKSYYIISRNTPKGRSGTILLKSGTRTYELYTLGMF